MKRSASVRSRRSFGVPGSRSRDSREPLVETRNPRPRILIVCEGAKTEPNYFLAFRVTNDVHGAGMETLRVVEEAERINLEDEPFDQIWCVFDRDSFPAADFDNAINKVHSRKQDGFRVAFSNEAFELWYMLHFEYLDAALQRDRYISKLHGHLKCTYRKGDPRMYDLLQTLGDEDHAQRNAQHLRALHDPKTPFSQCCPMTTVDALVQALRDVQRG